MLANQIHAKASKDKSRWAVHSGLLCCCVLAAIAGCGKSEANSQPSEPAVGKQEHGHDHGGPAKVVAEFMEALRSGDSSGASQLLTPIARQKTAEAKLEVGLPASKTASFEVGEVEMVEEDGAHVASTWSDEHDGDQRTDKIVWILRKEKEGWRVAGMAMKIFEDALPLILNFEDPSDMLRKQKLAEEELQRRAQAEESQASLPKNDLR